MHSEGICGFEVLLFADADRGDAQAEKTRIITAELTGQGYNIQEILMDNFPKLGMFDAA
jgi:hypothetical protein